VTACIVDLMRAQHDPPNIETYADWCLAMFGKTFAETFPFAYTRKYWTVEASEMSTDWIGKRIYPPKIEEVVRGALTLEQAGDFHYLSSFRYPRVGGYQSFMRQMYRPELVHLSKRVTHIDPARRRLTFADGSSFEYEQLISTMPLPEILPLLDPARVPEEVRAAATRLLCTSLVLVDVAVRRADLSDNHWFYVYDEDISFARGHFPHLLSPNNAPAGCGSIQLEVYHSRHRPLPVPRERLAEVVIEELLRMGVLRSPEEVLWTHCRDVKYANVVFDHQRTAALALLEPWLAAQGISSAGRYGEWAYLWTDDSVRSGWRAAARVLAGGCSHP
jgi:protoporphyrinogen oxidase